MTKIMHKSSVLENLAGAKWHWVRGRAQPAGGAGWRLLSLESGLGVGEVCTRPLG